MGIQISDYHAMRARLNAGRRCDSSPLLDGRSADAAPGVFPFTIKIPGQIKGGKNNMIVTRTGMHFPKPEWAKWRNVTVALIKLQLPPGWKPISEPCDVFLEYVAGDRRRRDMPAIVDSIFHCLEKAGVVEDDTLLWITGSTRQYDKENPMATIYGSKKF